MKFVAHIDAVGTRCSASLLGLASRTRSSASLPFFRPEACAGAPAPPRRVLGSEFRAVKNRILASFSQPQVPSVGSLGSAISLYP